jgi:hypothetical protein
MKRMWKIGVLLAAVAGLSVLVVGTAAAQGLNPDPPGPLFDGAQDAGMWGGHWEVFDSVAEALGLAPLNLFTELHSGKTLEEVASAHGVEMATVEAAIQNAREEERQARIQQAVADGTLTQEQADWMLQGMRLGMGGGRAPGGRLGGPSTTR